MFSLEPVARTAWHSHPLAQNLIVTAGCGLVQSWGDPVEKIRPGDVVWSPPGEKPDTVTGDAPCKASDKTCRMDTESACSFLGAIHSILSQ
jgi:hypothetical protein